MFEDHVEAEVNLVRLIQFNPELTVTLKPEYFFGGITRVAFEVMREQFGAGLEVDPVPGMVNRGNRIADATNLFSEFPEGTASHWGTLVQSNWLHREIRKAQIEFEKEADGLNRLNGLRGKLDEFENMLRTGTGAANGHDEFVQEMTSNAELIETHILELDDKLGGFEKGEYVFIAARPSRGKTALACCIALNIAKQSGRRVDYHSVEMIRRRTRRRFISNMTGIEVKRIKLRDKLPNWTQTELNRCLQASEILESYPLNIIGSQGKSIDQICYEIRSSDADVVFVDHIGKVDVSSKLSLYERLSGVSNRLCEAGKIPGREKTVIALVQLNRDVEKSDREPRASDLRDCGKLEEDADTILMIHEENHDKNRADNAQVVASKIIFEKTRDGDIGWRELMFDKRYSRFADKDPTMPKIPQAQLNINMGETPWDEEDEK